MKALFLVGLAVVILGILSFFVAIPHSENHGIKAGDVNIGVQTHDSQKVAPAISAVILVVGAGLMIAGRVEEIRYCDAPESPPPRPRRAGFPQRVLQVDSPLYPGVHNRGRHQRVPS